MSMSREQLLEWVQALPPKSAVFIDEGGLTLCCPEASEEGYLEIGGEPLDDDDNEDDYDNPEEGCDICSVCHRPFPGKTLESRWGDGDQDIPEGHDDSELICSMCKDRPAAESRPLESSPQLMPGDAADAASSYFVTGHGNMCPCCSNKAYKTVTHRTSGHDFEISFWLPGNHPTGGTKMPVVACTNCGCVYVKGNMP